MSWTKEELQRAMDEHVKGIEPFKLAPNAMQNIPDHLKQDLFSRMEYLLKGVCGDMEEPEYAYIKRFAARDMSLSEEQLAALDRYHHVSYKEMAKTVLACANNAQADWLELVKILLNAEMYFREQLSAQQSSDYKRLVLQWEFKDRLYMPDEIFEGYRLLLR